LRPETISKVLDQRYRLVINAAAYTDVDGCETNLQTASTLNATAVGQLAGRCAELGCKLVHYSTDYVFDGEASQPYPTSHPRRPLNAYGRTKAGGERLIESSDCDFLLIRTSWLFAPWGNNFVQTILRLAAERAELQVVDDQRGRPTSAQHLAETTRQLLVKGASGIFHITNGGECSWYDFAREIVAHRQLSCHVKPCRSQQFPRPATRPNYSVLDVSETEAILGQMPDWRNHLHKVLDQLGK
ncbi:MAG: dTDP-4-dehydrorhamnose reductase, partial [Planctomycetales bacterium]